MNVRLQVHYKTVVYIYILGLIIFITQIRRTHYPLTVTLVRIVLELLHQRFLHPCPLLFVWLLASAIDDLFIKFRFLLKHSYFLSIMFRSILIQVSEMHHTS